MFAGLLNKGFRGSLAVLIVLYLLSAGLNYFSTVPLENNAYPDLFYNYFTRNLENKFLINSLNFFCIGLGVFFMSMITSNQEISDKQNYFPVFLYLLICIAAVNPVQITPQIFTNVFVLLALYMLLDIYRKDKALKSIFEAAFWLSCSAFITISSIISFPLFFTILLVLRPFYWREWAIALLGFLTPVFLYESLAYLFGFNQWFLFDAIALFTEYMKVPVLSEYYFPLMLFLFLLLILSIVNVLQYGSGNTVKKQRSKTIFFWYLFFCIFGFFSGGANTSSILLLSAVPISFFAGDFLFRIRQTKVTNTLLTLMILCVLVLVLGKLGVI